jgi:fructuronate reductase
MADPVFAAYARRLWTREIIPALTPPPGADLTSYAQALANRYANPGIRHRTWQIAMDGSQKLPQRILGTLATTFDEGRHAPGLILAVAAWMRYVSGVDEQGQPIDVKDPMTARLRTLCDANPAPEARVQALLGVAEIFPPALVPRLTAPVTAALARLTDAGSRAAVADLTEVPA